MRLTDSAAFLQKHHILPQTELVRADCGFVFGNKHICSELAHEAARHYHLGYFDKILVSGGVETETGETEALVISRHLTNLGVPAGHILIENASRHTGENVEFSLPLLQDHSARSVIGFGHFSAGPRFLMTLARHCPDIHAMHKSVFPQGYGPDNWHESETLFRKTFEERHKIAPYIQQGFIAPIDLPLLNLKTAALRPPQKSVMPSPQLKYA